LIHANTVIVGLCIQYVHKHPAVKHQTLSAHDHGRMLFYTVRSCVLGDFILLVSVGHEAIMSIRIIISIIVILNITIIIMTEDCRDRVLPEL
jgi:hypothetical protein